MNKIDGLKHQVKLAFDLNVKNTHVLNSDDYMKQNTFIRFEDLFRLIEQVEQYEKALTDIAAYHRDWEIYSSITGIAKKALESQSD